MWVFQIPLDSQILLHEGIKLNSRERKASTSICIIRNTLILSSLYSAFFLINNNEIDTLKKIGP